jgi:2-(1,2-epoxy-1,2-dihydrophenyl)acetyl-CoA isomerase
MPVTHEFIVVEIGAGVMTITLNRPDVLNSFNAQMARELRGGAGGCARRQNLCAPFLLTGAGRAFCAGQDLSDVPMSAEGEPLDISAMVRATYNPVIKAIRKLELPVVCAVNGVAAGAGANLAIACDIVLAAENASFIQSFAKVGLIPDSGGTFFLPRIVGLPRATALMMTADKIDSRRAYEMGMVYKIYPADTLQQEAMKLATELAAMPTRGLGLTKRALNASLSNDLEEQLDLEADLQGEAGATRDFVEGREGVPREAKAKLYRRVVTALDPRAKIGVVGAGAMGAGIAQLAATHGHTVCIGGHRLQRDHARDWCDHEEPRSTGGEGKAHEGGGDGDTRSHRSVGCRYPGLFVARRLSRLCALVIEAVSRSST